MGYTPQLIGCIVVVRPGSVRVRGDQVIAPDVAGHAPLLLQLGHHFLAAEDELYQSSVFLDPAAQSFVSAQ